ncbi:hypothetical protein GMDG_08966 [Pseudogymnoascus destructans 20631-21]|uniref:Uncharacterized protein n=1 Tax=Pseudogymnoascus destructans (strain ATCC MYA-4855 / 20631-21) TaxID=658429 RepID=L8FSX8_PSED2|nr:hypothetical protein GMDG_08966 [Pseudogymnoascus destructans 20631-21]
MMTPNSSPPSRAAEDPWRNVLAMRRATACNRRSPAAGPIVSFTDLKLSRPMQSDAPMPPFGPATAASPRRARDGGHGLKDPSENRGGPDTQPGPLRGGVR